MSYRLLRLLPAIYRIRDAEQGNPLEQYLTVLGEQFEVLEESIAQLDDDLFIETCAEWVIPYIGELIGYRALYGVTPETASQRAEVANTIAYRRRKGTAAMLEQLARDVTGWNAAVVELFQRLGWTQNMNHVRPEAWYAPDLRRWEPLERLGTAFDPIARTIEVRRIATEHGRFNIPNIGIFLWRLDAYPLTASPAAPVAGDPRRFRFSPLGNDLPLVTLPRTESEISHLAEPLDVPEPIGRRVLDARLADYYGDGLSLEVFDGTVPVQLADVRVCDLSDLGGGWAHQPQNQVAVDPVLGRLAFPANQSPPADPRVSFHYGFPADLGGGEFERGATLDGELAPVTAVSPPASVQTALDARTGGGVVEISDSGRCLETLAVQVDAGARLELRSANEHRATVVLGGTLEITGGDDAEVSLNGLLISGGMLTVPDTGANGLLRLRITHCTLVPGLAIGADGSPAAPGTPSLVVEIPNVVVEIASSIVGGLRIAPGSKVTIIDSVVDATDPTGVAYADVDGSSAGGELSVERTTVIGKVHTSLLALASNSILDARLADADAWSAPVRSTRKQTGCLRFSYVPPGSRVPRRYRCQPELAVREAIAAALKSHPTLSPTDKAHIAQGVELRVQPLYTDTRYGRPAYAQLARACPAEIRSGADDEAEMGVYHDLYQPQRETNLRIRLDEYLRFGLEAGAFFAS